MGRIRLRDEHWQKEHQLRRCPREDSNTTEALDSRNAGVKMTEQMPMEQTGSGVGGSFCHSGIPLGVRTVSTCQLSP